MDIVWKNERPSWPDNRSVAATAFADSEEGGFESTGLQPANKPLIFVKNGAKRRKKTAKLPKAMDKFMTTVSTTPIPGVDGPAPPDNETTPAFYDYDDIVITEGFGESLNATPGNGWPVGSLEFLDSSRGTPSSSRSDHHDSPPGFPLHPNDTTMAMDDSDFEWQINETGHAMQPYGHGMPQSPNSLANLFPLSPGPLFGSTTQKAAAILDMCEFPFTESLRILSPC